MYMDAKTSERVRVGVGKQGRVVIPASLRRRLGIAEGDELLARAEGKQLVLEKREAVLERIRHRFAEVPEGTSLSDEVIADRREEARREGEA